MKYLLLIIPLLFDALAIRALLRRRRARRSPTCSQGWDYELTAEEWRQLWIDAVEERVTRCQEK